MPNICRRRHEGNFPVGMRLRQIPRNSSASRRALLRIHTRNNKEVRLSDAEWDDLAGRTEGYSGSDIATLVLGALMEPVRHMQSATHWHYTPGMQENKFICDIRQSSLHVLTKL